LCAFGRLRISHDTTAPHPDDDHAATRDAGRGVDTCSKDIRKFTTTHLRDFEGNTNPVYRSDSTDKDLTDRLRWDFKLRSGPNFKLDRGEILGSVGYAGDIETKSVLLGCHLNPLYPLFNLYVVPGIVQPPGSNEYLLGPDYTHLDARLEPFNVRPQQNVSILIRYR
jgi:hypothetical protein